MPHIANIGTLLALAFVLVSFRAQSETDDHLRYERLYADADGSSRFSEDAMPWQRAENVAGATQTIENLSLVATELRFVRTPPGFESEWHTTSRRQFLLVMEGTVEFETRNGDKRQFEAGSLILTEDTTGEGHITRNVGDEELVMALVTVPAEN